MKTYGGVEVYRSTHFLTSALRGELLASRFGRFTPAKGAPAPIEYEAGWAPEPVWTRWLTEKSVSYRELNFVSLYG